MKQERSIELKTTSFQQNLEEVNNLDKYDHNLIPFTLIFNNNHQFIGCYDEERLIFEKERFHPGFSQIFLELSYKIVKFIGYEACDFEFFLQNGYIKQVPISDISQVCSECGKLKKMHSMSLVGKVDIVNEGSFCIHMFTKKFLSEQQKYNYSEKLDTHIFQFIKTFSASIPNIDHFLNYIQQKYERN